MAVHDDGAQSARIRSGDDGLRDDEFAGLMGGLGPWGAGRRVVVGVSGGADSMALALLCRRWGEPLGVVVDHGLRAGSADEAALTVERLAGMGVPARVVRLGLAAGADVGARARWARYAALLAMCAAEGVADLLVGHHARDQAETVALRAAGGSGAAGMAGMGTVGYRGAARVVRPLLTIDPDRLRATLRGAGVEWVEDPANRDPRTARGALRMGGWARVGPEAGVARAAAERLLAEELAGVAIFPGGYAEVQGGLSSAAWSALIWTISGRAYPPPPAGVAGMVTRGGGTLHGVVLRRGAVFREAAAMEGAVAAGRGAAWDGRFVLREAVEGGVFGAVGAAAGRLRRRPGLPVSVLATLPGLWLRGKLLAVPHLAFADSESWLSVEMSFRPARPLAGAPFVPC